MCFLLLTIVTFGLYPVMRVALGLCRLFGEIYRASPRAPPRERQAEGIAAAKQRGAYRGRPPRIDMEAIRHRLAPVADAR